MKSKIVTLTALAAFTVAAFPHERITIGPNGGRVIYLDSTAIPNVEFLVNKEGRAEIRLLDKERKPMRPAEQNIIVTAGPRASAQKLKAEKREDTFLTEPVPAGPPYTVVIQIKEKPGAKALIARVNFDPTPAKSGKPEYLDDSVNVGSGPNIQVPEAIDALFGEINQHQGELKDGFAERKYEALDEVTQAFPVLLTALPARSGDKSAAVQASVDSLVKDLAAIAQANAARDLAAARANLDSFNTGLLALKKNYPDGTANAKLKD